MKKIFVMLAVLLFETFVSATTLETHGTETLVQEKIENTNAQRIKFWFSSLDGRKNLVLVETNTGKACFLQSCFPEVFGAEVCTVLWDTSFEKLCTN